jgi:hypothetical protein
LEKEQGFETLGLASDVVEEETKEEEQP